MSQISDDESVCSAHSDGEFYSASEDNTTEETLAKEEQQEDGGEMHDASDRALAEPFIYG